MKIKLISYLIALFLFVGFTKANAITLSHNQATNIGCNVNASAFKDFTFTKVLANNVSITVACEDNNGDLALKQKQSAQIQCINNAAGTVSPTQLSIGNNIIVTCNPTSVPGLAINKLATAPIAIGSGICQLFAIAGTNSGTCKLQLQCGTSSTPVTIIDNVGAGC